MNFVVKLIGPVVLDSLLNHILTGVAKFTRSEERGCGFVLRKFQQARTAKVCTLALLLNDLEIDSSLLPSPIPSLK